MYNNIENKTGMKHYKRTRKQLIKEEPKLCSNGSIQWGKFNIKLDVNPDVSFSGVDWKGGSYGCSISWMIAPPSDGDQLMWRGQQKVYDIESAYNHLVNVMNVPEDTALTAVNELAPIIMGMGKNGPKNPFPKPTPTYDEYLPEGRRHNKRLINEEMKECGGSGGGGDDKYTFSWKVYPDGGGNLGGTKVYVTCSFTIRFKVAPPGGPNRGGMWGLEQAMEAQGIPVGQIEGILSTLKNETDANGSSSVTLNSPPCPGICDPPQTMDANCNCTGGVGMLNPKDNPFPKPVGPSGPLPRDLYI
tara:strand:+ start:1106 stop:2011 length:906 start_codon:yes stop_codon:yes gene_type:complete